MTAEAVKGSLTLPRILIVDHFDSYTLNLLSLLSKALDIDTAESSKAAKGKQRCRSDHAAADGAAIDALLDSNVVVLAHTHPLLASEQSIKDQLLPFFDAVILSPGPGTPHDEADFGAGHRLLRLQAAASARGERTLPILGVCLGHQGIAVAFGGKVRRAKAIRHGVVSAVRYQQRASASQEPGSDLFDGLTAGFNVIRYNSLTVDAKSLPSCLEVTAWSTDPPNPHPSPRSAASFPVQPPSRSVTPVTTPALSRSSSYDAVPSLSVQAIKGSTAARTGEEVVLALRHRTLPIWGVQFHPESIESQSGVALISNWLKLVAKHGGLAEATIPPSLHAAGRQCVAGAQQKARSAVHHGAAVLTEHVDGLDDTFGQRLDALFERCFLEQGGIWLDSARRWDPHSRFSYMALPSLWLSYHSSTRTVTVGLPDGIISPAQVQLGEHDTWWTVVSDLAAALSPSTEDATSPLPQDPASVHHMFKSGLIGYFGYGMSSEGVASRENTGPASKSASHRPDSEIAVCPRLLAYDHHTNTAIISSFCLGKRTTEATERTTADVLLNSLPLATIDDLQQWTRCLRAAMSAITEASPLLGTPLPTMVSDDSQAQYIDKVEACRAHIAAGESYELCLTTQFRGRLPEDGTESSRMQHYKVYKGLRSRNAAPYSAFMPLPQLANLPPRTICSTSPERFMRASADGELEMKPIKGTVPRAGFGTGEEHWRAAACDCSSEVHDTACPELEKTRWRDKEDNRRCDALAADIKERAENLMIVDLIRADLLAMCRPSSVAVPALMKVESYASVHQLVTTVRGELKDGVSVVEALARSFPPGSMTGAPKKRSVAILEQIEKVGRDRQAGKENERGVYSGILGWIGLDGAADFSVVIRTAVLEGNEVTLGAGGAITYASDPAAEWNEVLFKAKALCRVG